MTSLAALLHPQPGSEAVGCVAVLHSPHSLARLRSTVEGAGWEFAALDGTRVARREDFLSAAGNALVCGSDWGRNFDALADVLRDVPHASASGTVLLWESWGRFATHGEHWFDVALDVLAERAERRDLPPFLVLLRGPGPDLGLPVVDA